MTLFEDINLMDDDIDEPLGESDLCIICEREMRDLTVCPGCREYVCGECYDWHMSTSIPCLAATCD